MSIQEKLKKAKIQLILTQPFFATLLFRLPIIENPAIKTSEVNGMTIQVNPQFIDKLNIDEVKTILCHDVLHVANLHHTRREGRDAAQWNKATDYAINPLLVASGMKLPDGALLKKEYENLSAEQIFKLIQAEEEKDKDSQNSPQDQNKPQQGAGQANGQGNDKQQGKDQPQGQKQPTPDPGNMGSVTEPPKATPAEIAQQEAEIKQAVAQAAQVARKAGQLPGYLEELIKEILTPKVNWKEVLNRYILDQAKNDYSFSRPNTRYIHSGFYLPSLHNLEPGKIYLIVDTSGSIDRKLLDEFGGELIDICNEVKAGLTIIYVDTKVQGVQEVEPDETPTIKPIGRGGTDFRPGFEWIEKENFDPRAVIYFTDGDCHSFPKVAPDYPTLWATYNNSKFSPPFGEVIPVN